jgi:hypothetical protein
MEASIPEHSPITNRRKPRLLQEFFKIFSIEPEFCNILKCSVNVRGDTPQEAMKKVTSIQ